MNQLKKSRLWIMVGVPGSGKSTWIKDHMKFFATDCKVISRDVIRFSIVNEDEEYFSKEKEVWNEFVRQAKESLNCNTDTIIDATHINEASRTKLLRALAPALSGIEINAIVINVSLGTAIDQNEMREGRSLVPESAIERMFDNFTIPDIEEGFNNIYIYEKEDEKVTYQIIRKEVE